MATLPPFFPTQFFNGAAPAAAGRLYAYVSGTTTPKATYTDAAAVTPNTNPIVLDQYGKCDLWLGDGAYTFVLKDSGDALIDSWDGIEGFPDDVGSAEYDPAAAAPAGSLGAAIKSFVHVSYWGALGDGITLDRAKLQQALDEGLNLDFGDASKNYRISGGSLNVRDGAYLRGAGARIFQEDYQTPLFNVVGKSNVTITGLNMTGCPMTTATAGTFVTGRRYSIISVGTTDFTLIGASSNTPGVFFTATGAGTGTGTASTFYNTPNSQDIGIKADSATNLVVAFCTFNGFAYSPLMVALWGTNIKFLHNVVSGPGSTVLNPLSLADPQTPGFRNCTGVTILGYGVEIHGNQIQNTSQGMIIGQQSRDVVVTSNNVLNTIVEHGMYCDTACRHVRIAHNSFANTKLIGAKVQWYDVTMAATALVANGTYVIQTLGTTDFTTVGASSNAVGVEFKATGPATGTGTCVLPTPMNIVLSNNSIDTTGGDGLLVINAGTATIATLTGVTQANPGVFTTAAAHGLAVGDLIDIGGVVGMTPVNSSFRVAAVPTTTTFRVRTPAGEVNTTSFPAYVSGGTVKRPVYGRNIVISNNTLRNIGQDCISARYLDGGLIEGNTIQTGARVGIYQLITLNTDTSGNIVRDTQQNGIYCYSPLDQCSIFDNTLTNVGAAGIDTAGASSGIFFEGDGGGTVEGNIVHGEYTRTKMLYGLQLGSGDKTQWSIVDNQIYDAESAIVAIHGLDNASLRQFSGNIGTAASGPDALTGLATALPNRGNPRPDWWGNDAPTSGFWAQGSKVWKLLPNSADPIGWVCSTSGTPGGWQPFGKVHAVLAPQALSGSYTPTISATGNVSLATPRICLWKVDGDWVTVTGRVGIKATSTSTPAVIHMSLPIATDLGASSFQTLFGNFASSGNQFAGAIWNPGSGASQNTARFQSDASTTSDVDVHFTFHYKLVIA